MIFHSNQSSKLTYLSTIYIFIILHFFHQPYYLKYSMEVRSTLISQSLPQTLHHFCHYTSVRRILQLFARVQRCNNYLIGYFFLNHSVVMYRGTLITDIFIINKCIHYSKFKFKRIRIALQYSIPCTIINMNTILVFKNL